MKKFSSKGFTVVEVLLVIAVVAVFGIGSYFILQGREATPQSAQINQNNAADQRALSTLDCVGKFSVELPKGWYSSRIENGGNCAVSNVPESQLPAVGNLSGENISFVFETYPKMTQSTTVWVEDYFKDVNDTYPISVLSIEPFVLDNGKQAVLVLAKGGHYNTKDYYFFFKKGDMGILTSWDSTSKLSNKAKEVLKTLN